MNFLGLYLTGSIAGSIVNYLFQNEGSGVRFFSASVGGDKATTPVIQAFAVRAHGSSAAVLRAWCVMMRDFAMSRILWQM